MFVSIESSNFGALGGVVGNHGSPKFVVRPSPMLLCTLFSKSSLPNLSEFHPYDGFVPLEAEKKLPSLKYLAFNNR